MVKVSGLAISINKDADVELVIYDSRKIAFGFALSILAAFDYRKCCELLYGAKHYFSNASGPTESH